MTQKNVLVFRALPEDQLARLQAAHHVTVADPRKEPEAFTAALRTANGKVAMMRCMVGFLEVACGGRRCRIRRPGPGCGTC